MKKKIFTLLALALCICSAAWAAENTTLISGITLPSVPTGTYKGGTEVTHKNSNKAVVIDGDGNAIMQASAPGYGNPTGDFSWANSYDGSNDGGWSTTGASWDAKGIFVGSSAYNNSSSAHNVAFARRCNLRNVRTVAYRFTNCGGVSVLVKSQGTTESAAACMAVYEVGASNSLTAVETDSSYTNALDILTVEDLSATKTYVAYIYGMNGSNGELYEIAFLPPSEDSPKLNATPNTLTLTATESGELVNGSFTITGENLTAGTYDLTVPSVAGLSVSPTSFTVAADGTVSQVVNVSYSSTENVASTSTNITATVDELNLSVAVNYAANVISWTLQPVSSETIWDFSKLVANTSSSLYNSSDQAIKLSEETTPSITDDVVYADYDGTHVTFGAEFDATSIAFTGQYPIRRNQFAQNGTLHFKTSVPGTIVVKFSDTGSSASATAVKRYLVVNGKPTEYWASRQNNDPDVGYAAQLNVTSGDIPVPAGDVTITGTSALVMSYVKFTPAAATTINLNSSGYATYSNYYDVEVSGAKVYTAALDTDKGEITCTEVSSGKVPAGAGVLLYGTANAEVTLTPTTGAAALSDNDLKGTTKSDGTLAEKEANGIYYSLSGNAFMTFNGAAFVANKAYFEAPSGGQGARSFSIVFNDGGYAAAIEGVSPAERSADSVFDLQGRRVEKPVKGIYVVNGKKVVIK